MSEQANTVTIKGDNAALTLEMLRYEYPYTANVPDGNPIFARVCAGTSAFKADFTHTIYPFDLVSLKATLAELYSMSEGEVEWRAAENFLNFTAERNRSGHIWWKIELIQHPDREAYTRLFLEINNDQTYLPYILQEIDAVLEVLTVIEYEG